MPGNKIAWRVLDNNFTFIEDKAEWIGTTMLFDIERIGTQTKVKFTHDGLVPDYECYDVCHDAWGTYINGSLKDLITSGKGQPNAGIGCDGQGTGAKLHDRIYGDAEPAGGVYRHRQPASLVERRA